MIPKIIIDSEKCTLCQKCVRSCPVEILQYQKKDTNKKKGIIEIIDSSQCLECRACEIVCPEAAITVHAGNK
ncbi:MAG: 4Fe-4S binding protein [Candidatus Heimdallarchaeota archaeon]|nr:4Fe-4S binding protein [Candidatus Heimdallarchaeota archaeon]